jgi:outer membrane protein OmpU
MKKVLLTTSALTLLAGAAAADVSVSGYGRLGVQNSGSTTSNYIRNRISFSGSATSDGGLSMSAWTRYQHGGAGTAAAVGSFAGPRLTLSNGSMTLTAGNGAGAIGWTSGLWGCGAVMWGCADVTNDSWDWASTSSGGAGPNVVRLDMSLGGASVSVSGGNSNDTEAAISMPLGGGSVGVGFDNNSASTQTMSINYSGSMGGMGVGLRMAQQSGSGTGYMATVSAPMAAGSVYVFAGKTLGASNNYGLRYNQDLGGGVSMQAGVTSAAGETTVGAGVHFGF